MFSLIFVHSHFESTFEIRNAQKCWNYVRATPSATRKFMIYIYLTFFSLLLFVDVCSIVNLKKKQHFLHTLSYKIQCQINMILSPYNGSDGITNWYGNECWRMGLDFCCWCSGDDNGNNGGGLYVGKSMRTTFRLSSFLIASGLV